MPEGWRQAWGAAPPLASGARAAGAPANAPASDDPDVSAEGALALPVIVYVSSVTGDRRVAKHCRWAIDFLVSKKVPFAVLDLSVHPHMRQRLVQQLALASPGRGSQLSTRRAEEALQHLPVIDIGGLQTLSKDELQDLEDQGQLDPLLSTVICEYAERLTKGVVNTPPRTPPRAKQPPPASLS